MSLSFRAAMWKTHTSVYCSDTKNFLQTGKRNKLQNKNVLMPPKYNHLIHHSYPDHLKDWESNVPCWLPSLRT